MKCAICSKKTNWDSSYGRPTFIVCGCCFEKLKEEMKDDMAVLGVILTIGRIKEKENKK